jgi:hypothetical protein
MSNLHPSALDVESEPGPSLADLEWDMLRSRETATADPPAEPTLPMAEWIAVQAAYFRSLGSNLGDWLARRIDALAEQARSLQAETPDQYDAREELMDRWIAEREEEVGR